MGVTIMDIAVFVVPRPISQLWIVVRSIPCPSSRLGKHVFCDASTCHVHPLHGTLLVLAAAWDIPARFRRDTEFGGYLMQIDNPQ